MISTQRIINNQFVNDKMHRVDYYFGIYLSFGWLFIVKMTIMMPNMIKVIILLFLLLSLWLFCKYNILYVHVEGSSFNSPCDLRKSNLYIFHQWPLEIVEYNRSLTCCNWYHRAIMFRKFCNWNKWMRIYMYWAINLATVNFMMINFILF